MGVAPFRFGGQDGEDSGTTTKVEDQDQQVNDAAGYEWSDKGPHQRHGEVRRICFVGLDRRVIKPDHEKDRQARKPKGTAYQVIGGLSPSLRRQPIVAMGNVDQEWRKESSRVVDDHYEQGEGQTEDQHELLIGSAAHPSI